MNLMVTLLSIEFTPYIPTTILGLLGLVSGYLYFLFKNKDDNKLKGIQSTNPKDRLKAIEVNLNELGVSIDTRNLTPADKYKLLEKSLTAKTRKYLIISITAIIFSGIVGFLFYDNNHKRTEKQDASEPKDTSISDTKKNHVKIDSSPHSVVVIGDSNKIDNK